MRLINIAQAGPLDEAPPLSSLLDDILQFLVTLIGGVAVLVIVVAGIMYMTSGGDSERVQTAKKMLIGGVVGLVVAVMSFIIATTVINII